MNNRFVVPAMAADNVTKFATLQAALTAPALNAGDVIQIEPNSSPGQLHSADIPALKNLTIQGDPAIDVQSIPYFSDGDIVTIGSAQQGFTLKNVEVDIQNGDLRIETDATVTGCRIKYEGAYYDGIYLGGTSAVVISNCYIENVNPQVQGADLLEVDNGGSHNRISDNQLVALQGTNITLVRYDLGYSSSIPDVVAHNTFIDNSGNNATTMFLIFASQALTVQGNTFTDYDPNGTAISAPSAQNLQLVDNVISFANGATSSTGIYVSGKGSANVIADNHISTGGQGTGLWFDPGTPGSSLFAKVQDNDLHGNGMGVLIDNGAGGLGAGIDLGGGSQGSMGANNFRGDTTAISVAALAAAGPIMAQKNIFGVPDPTTVIHDQHVDPTLAAVVSANPLTGNAAYVGTLYLDFLHRAGDLSNPKDAGGWVTLMGKGLPAATVASLVARSPEGLGVAVDGLYHRILGRDADPAGRAGFVAYLQAGGTLEGASQIMLASPEYQARFPTGSSFVQSVYQNLLNRTGSSADVNSWVAQLPQLGRAGVAQGFLLSGEFRTDEVSDDYSWFLHRAGSTSDIASWVSGGKDLLTIDTLFAGSQEFQMNG